MFNKTLLSSLVVAIATTAASASYASTCKDVNIVAHNKTGKQIKVIDMYYRTYDGAGNQIQKREEAVSNVVINKGNPYTTSRKLEGANGLTTKLYIEYRVRKKHSGWDQWTNVKRQASGKFVCHRYKTVKINLRKK